MITLSRYSLYRGQEEWIGISPAEVDKGVFRRIQRGHFRTHTIYRMSNLETAKRYKEIREPVPALSE
jgi:hypothetical protein